MTEQEVLSIQTILLSKFPYYQKLSSVELKEKFEKRVSKFIDRKQFDGRGLEITPEIKVLIAATAVQLTFGMNKYLFKHFDRIIIYPDKFYSPFSKSKNVGEVNTAGIIVLSWKAFKDGMKEHEDGFNVALHEMAHALNLTDLMGKDVDDLFSQYFDKWYVVARKILKNREAEERKFLRTYAGKNLQEFFAVGVEYFFEQSADFKKECPELYKHFSYLLNQDPTNKDYRIKYNELPANALKNNQSARQTISSKDSRGKYYLGIIIPIIFIILCYTYFNLNKVFLFFITITTLFRLLVGNRPTVIEIYDNYFQLKKWNIFGSKWKKVELRNVISVNYTEDSEDGNILKLIFYDKGIIGNDSIQIKATFESLFPLFKLLFEEHDIAVKENGKIFIPVKEPLKEKEAWWKRW